MFMLPVRGEYWVTETWASEGDEEQTVVFHGLEGKVCDPNSLASAFFSMAFFSYLRCLSIFWQIA